MGTVIRVGILTISDRCSQGEQEDLSGPAIQKALPTEGYVVALSATIADDALTIQKTLKRWCREFSCHVILTTGGTGFSPRDVTPEATHKVIEKEAPNISHYLLSEGLKRSPFAALSRGIAGVRGETLIVNLPGSPSGAQEGTEALLPLLPHLVEVLTAQEKGHPGF